MLGSFFHQAHAVEFLSGGGGILNLLFSRLRLVCFRCFLSLEIFNLLSVLLNVHVLLRLLLRWLHF